MGLGFEPDARHADGIFDPLLIVYQEKAGDDVENFALGGEWDSFGGFHDTRHIGTRNLAIWILHRDETFGILRFDVDTRDRDDGVADRETGHALGSLDGCGHRVDRIFDVDDLAFPETFGGDTRDTDDSEDRFFFTADGYDTGNFAGANVDCGKLNTLFHV
jgi:hypothetical protein